MDININFSFVQYSKDFQGAALRKVVQQQLDRQYELDLLPNVHQQLSNEGTVVTCFPAVAAIVLQWYRPVSDTFHVTRGLCNLIRTVSLPLQWS